MEVELALRTSEATPHHGKAKDCMTIYPSKYQSEGTALTNYLFNLPRVLKAYPEQTSHILHELERIKQLSAECGCAMGAKFMLGSAGVVGIYFVFFSEIVFPKILIDVFIGFIIIFVSSAAGKILGIGLAKLRLAQVYKSLRARYPIQGE